MSAPVKKQSPAAPPSYDEIARIIGRRDDDVIAAIIATGASASEIHEAVIWTLGDSEQMAELRRPLTGTVADVYDILARGLCEDEEEP